MINIKNFQSEIQKNMQAMVNEHKALIRENNQLKAKVEQLEQTLAVENVVKTDKQAVVIFAADVSGSMGAWEKNIGKDYTKRLLNVLNERYKYISTRHIHHNTEAKVVAEGEFLNKCESGGTIVSSAYRLINKELEDFDYENDNLDVFVVHISDGDNLSVDNARTVKLVEKVLKKATVVTYIEVNQYDRHSPLLQGRNGLKSIVDGTNFDYGIIRSEKDPSVLVKTFAKLHLN